MFSAFGIFNTSSSKVKRRFLDEILTISLLLLDMLVENLPIKKDGYVTTICKELPIMGN